VSANNPLPTLEVRWFFDGAATSNSALVEWFEGAILPEQYGGAPALQWKERTDTYLLLPAYEDMGIKLREGQVQVKGRVATLGEHTFCGRHEGIVEHWVKWSYAGLPAAYYVLFGANVDPDLVTFAVRKRRALRKLLLDPDAGTVTQVSTDAVIDHGLGFELTELEINGRAYSTIAFEVFPHDPVVEALALDTVGAMLGQLVDVQLAVESSCSYPAWLRRLAEI